MADLGSLHHFLGINVHHNTTGLHLSQEQYALEISDRVGILNYKPVSTPVDTTSKLSGNDDAPFHDPSLCLARALQYLTLTRPYISYVVQQCCLFIHDPKEGHYEMVKRVLR